MTTSNHENQSSGKLSFILSLKFMKVADDSILCICLNATTKKPMIEIEKKKKKSLVKEPTTIRIT